MEKHGLRQVQDLAPTDILPQLSIDCVIFGFHDGQLKILLLRFKNTEAWALPGGFVFQNESIDSAAQRILFDRTGLRDIYLEQFYVFGAAQRNHAASHKDIFKANNIQLSDNHWIMQRFVSIGYYALVDFSKATPIPDDSSDACMWFDMGQKPDLVFDHDGILEKALDTLRLMLDYKLVGFNLMPETFTMNELQVLYETVLGKKLLRTNFQRKILSLEILERIDKKFTGAANKAPYLYRFDAQKAARIIESR